MRSYLYIGIISVVMLAGCGGSDDSTLFLSANDYCGVNAPVGPVVIDKKTPIQPWGWAFDKSTGKIPEKIFIQIVSEDNKVGVKAAMSRMSRPDVGKAFGRAELDMAGYGGKIDLNALPSGTYSVSIVQSDAGRTSICTSPSKITLQ